MPLTLDEFQREEFQGYVENVPARRQYLLAPFMPDRPIFDVKFAYNVINQAYSRTASITGFNAGAPLRDKQGLAKAFGEVAKVQHGFRLDEEELLKFNRPRSDEERDQAVQYVYDQTDDLIQGVRDIEEWMRAQAIYNGRLVYNENDVVLDIDFGIANVITETTPWTGGTGTPLADLQAAVKQFKDTNRGQMPRVMHMSSSVEFDLMRSTEIKNNLFGNPADTRIVTREMLRGLFNSLGLPPYEVNDEEMDNGDGIERLLPERRIVMLGDQIGRTYFGPTVENNYRPGIYVVPEVKTTNPPSQAVFVGETVFPAIERTTAILHLNV